MVQGSKQHIATLPMYILFGFSATADDTIAKVADNNASLLAKRGTRTTRLTKISYVSSKWLHRNVYA
jgi:hypothetical protein